jgi:AbrB family looped-hinge helix DNA binding protein
MSDEKGICTKCKVVYGTVTVSDKGQIAIPVELRRDLGIVQGDMLLVLKRKDGTGFTLIRVDSIEDFFQKVQEHDDYFSEKEGGE